MNLFEAFKKSPGFVYQIGTQYYFLGRYICSPCDTMEICDTHAMYDLCSSESEQQNAAFYFQKLRAYSDFALEAPFNPAKVQADLEQLLNNLTDFQLQTLEKQYLRFAKDMGLE